MPPLTAYMALSLPFLLNDFGNMRIHSFTTFIMFDYIVVKAIPLGGIAWLIRTGRLSLADFGLVRMPWKAFLAWTAVLTGLGLCIDDYGWRFFEAILPDTSLTAIPFDTGSWLYGMDCFVGLALVALAEETVFRGIALTALRERGLGPVGAVAAAAVVFGCIHWSQGLHAIANTAIIGALFGVAMWRTGSVLPQMAAHFVVNYVSFCACLPNC